MLEFDAVKGWLGKRVVGSDGEAIGKFEEVYLDRRSGQPEWAAIRTGMFGSKVSFAPIEGAGVDGDDVRLAYAKSAVKDAPTVDADGELTPEEEQRLFEHYGRADYSEWDQSSDATESAMGRDERWDRAEDARDRAEPEVGGRQEVGGRPEVRGVDDVPIHPRRARLRRYIVTEEVITDEHGREDAHVVDRELLEDEQR